MNDPRSEIEAYLRDNAELRDALGIDGDAKLTAHPLGMGEHNLNYWFSDPDGYRRFVLRVNVTKQPFHSDQVLYEFNALKALVSSGCTPIPLYIDRSDRSLREGVLVESFCEGDELDFDDLRPGDMRCAAQLMADIHATPIEKECPIFRPKDPLETLFLECRDRYSLYLNSPASDERVARWMDKFMKAAARSLDTPSLPENRAHIVNTETLPSHFLIPQTAAIEASEHEGAGRFCEHPGYFVDWERPIIGEVAEDVAFFIAPTTIFWDSETLFPSDHAQEFVEDYWNAVDGRFSRGNFDCRFKAFKMMTVLRALTWCCRAEAFRFIKPEVHITDKAAAKVPIYLSDDFLEMLAKDCFGL